MNRSRVVLALTLAVAALICYQLLLADPVVGLADNGDYSRTANLFGLGSTITDPAGRYENFLVRKYVTDAYWQSGYYSSQQVLIAAAVLANKVISKDGLFDITLMGAVNALFLLAGFGVFLAGLSSRTSTPVFVLLCATGLVFFFDTGYIAYLNSFYTEPVGYACLFALAGFYLLLAAPNRGTKQRKWLLAGYGLAALLLITSKMQYVPLAPLLAGLGWIAAGAAPLRTRWILPAVILAAAILYWRVGDPPYADRFHRYNTLAMGVLYQSPTLEADLAELGIPPQYAGLVGKHYWQIDPALAESQAVTDEFISKGGYAQVIGFYLRHPARLVFQINLSMQRGLALSPEYLGNFEASAGLPPLSINRSFNLWSSIRTSILPQSAWPPAAILLAGLLLGIWQVVRGRRIPGGFSPAALTLAWTAMAGLCLLTAVLGEGQKDIVKHLFFYNALLDMLVLFLAAAAGEGALAFIRAARRPARSTPPA